MRPQSAMICPDYLLLMLISTLIISCGIYLTGYHLRRCCHLMIT